MQKIKVPIMALVVILMVGLSACASQPGAEDLLRAPQLSTKLSIVQKALNNYLGESAQLKYPHSGEVSSPFLFSDLDGDGQEEAVVLYQSDGKGLNVHLAVLEQVGEDWIVTQEIEGPSTNVESVYSAQLQQGKGNQLVVLYSAPTAKTEDYLAVYFYRDSTLQEKTLLPCAAYLLQDVTGSGTQNVVLARKQNDRLSITILEEKNDTLQSLPEFMLDKRFANCESIASFQKGKEYYIAVDGIDPSGYTITQLLQYVPNTGKLMEYTPKSGDNILDVTARLKPGLYSTDINQDGIVEIPKIEQEITTVDSSRRLAFITWRDFTRNSNTIVQFGILDMEYGFFLRLPVAWKDKIMVTDGMVADSWQIRNLDATEWYVNIWAVNREKEINHLEDYTQIGVVGQNRILMEVNPRYKQQKELIIKGMYWF